MDKEKLPEADKKIEAAPSQGAPEPTKRPILEKEAPVVRSRLLELIGLGDCATEEGYNARIAAEHEKTRLASKDY